MERQRQDVDFSQLGSDQLEKLRGKLRDFAKDVGGTAISRVPVDNQDPGCCHSSHFDNDGWF